MQKEWLSRNAGKAASVLALGGMTMTNACTNIECPLNNTVYATYNIYGTDSLKSFSITDTLTVTAVGTDSVLYNKGIGISTFTLPMSYTGAADTLLFTWTDTSGNTGTDTLVIAHTNRVHFESLDCNTTVFHTVTGVKWSVSEASSSPMQIDSVEVINPEIDYNGNENFRLYLSAR